MKKTLLSAASFAVVAVSAVAVAPTTSEAIPAFARQTGAACLSCHFQTFPAVSAFGRSFKMGAFTDVGEQALIEDDALSLPSVLNSTFVLRAQYQNDRTTNLTTGLTTGATAWAIPADAVMMIGGRVGSNTGAFVEIGFGTGGGAGNWQLLNSFDFDSFKGGINIANAGFGPTGAIEVSNVFGQHGGKLNGKQLSSVEQIINKGNINGNTTSVALWAGSESFLVQAAGVAMADATAVTSPSFVPMLRATYIADLGSAELMIGGAILSGVQSAVGVAQGVNATWIDFQVQGEMGDMSYGIYGDFTSTKAKGTNAGTTTNLFANNTNAKVDGYSIRAEIKPTHALMVGFGVGQVKTTPLVGLATKRIQTQVAATYEIYQNMEINAWFLNDDNKTTVANGGKNTKTKTVFAEVEALF